VVSLGLYHHHGIATSDGFVVHFGRGIFDIQNAVVEEVALDVFCQDKPIRLVDSTASFSSDEIVTRARSRIGKRDYDLFENNCEHFANWCRSGQNESHQVNVSETFVRQSAAVCTKPLIGKLALSTVSKSASTRVTAVAARYLARGPAIAAGVADAVQATAEIVAAKNGRSKRETRRIGRQAGVASSVAIGWMVGGPVTAAAGVGIWFFGQVAATQTVEAGKHVVGLAIGPTGQESS